MKFNIITLGCKVNAYESNVMKEKLIDKGYQYTDSNDADIFIINTCTVTNQADNKSLKMIRHVKKINKNAIIVVVGCLVESNRKQIEENGFADIIIGNIGKSRIVEYIERFKNNLESLKEEDIMHTKFEPMVLNNFDKTRAFVKIQDGCNNFCSYCIIPFTRGNVRSKAKEDVLLEVTDLVRNGHKEIVLTGIHTGNYGAEFENYKFKDLLKDLVNIPKLERIRISSIEMNEINDEIIDLFKNYPILVDHIHMPIQSGSNKILKSMHRKYDKDEFINKVKRIRKVRPNISITTDLIVGFPTETEEDFNETIETIKKINFSKIHVFPYSKRDGTVAASMKNQVDDVTKKQRVKKILELSSELEKDYMNKFINDEVVFIPEVYRDGYIIGHTGNYLQIKIKGTKDDLNKDIKVKIKEISYPYCLGERI